MSHSEGTDKPAARLSAFLGLQRSTVGVLAMVVLVGMGERMGERFLPVYIIALGGGALWGKLCRLHPRLPRAL